MIPGYWKLLIDDIDYSLQDELGYIRFKVRVNDHMMVAVAYEDIGGRNYEDISFNPEQDSTIHLKLIKPKHLLPKDKTWNLMFRHIYYLGDVNIDPDLLKIRIYYKHASGDDEYTLVTNIS